jgi:hypothetical protein
LVTVPGVIGDAAMSLLRSSTLLLALLVTSIGCGADALFEEGASAPTIDELRALRADEVLGDLAFGSTAGPIAYTDTPKYRAFRVRAEAGDVIDAWIRSTDGDPMAWILAPDFRTLVQNRNAGPLDRDAHVVHRVARAGTYYLAFREEDQEDATFQVTLAPRATVADAGVPDGAGPDGAGPDGAGPDGAGPDGAGPDGAGPDGAGADGAAVEIARVYANTDDALFEMDPTTKSVRKIGVVTGLEPKESVTDIAVDARGRVFGVTGGSSGGRIIELELPSGGTGAVKAVGKRDLGSERFYALAFAPAGILGAEETLVGGDANGSLWMLPLDAPPSLVGDFGQVLPGDPNYDKGAYWQLSGDLVFFSNRGTPIGLATVRNHHEKKGLVEDDDAIVEIDMAALARKDPKASLRKRLIGRGTGFGRLFGVGAWGDEIFAFQRAFAHPRRGHPAQLIAISLTSGTGTKVRDFAEIVEARNGWSGAGVTTAAKIHLP